MLLSAAPALAPAAGFDAQASIVVSANGQTRPRKNPPNRLGVDRLKGPTWTNPTPEPTSNPELSRFDLNWPRLDKMWPQFGQSWPI